MPASALVIGSMAPDLPFYLPLPQWYPTHTWLAGVTTDLLLGLLAWALWHGLLAEPASATAPAALRGRLAGGVAPGLAVRIASVRQVVLLVVALVLGTATHLAWDAFTHARRWGAEHLSVLAESWGPLPGYRWLQYASSVVGLAVLLVWFVRWWRRTPAVPTRAEPAARWVWPLLAVLAVGAGTVAGLAAGSLDDAVFPAAQWAGGTVLLIAVLLAIGWHLTRRRSSSLTARVPGSRQDMS
nr:DUF4184 family protein [Petropleomorpha daqingensis]